MDPAHVQYVNISHSLRVSDIARTAHEELHRQSAKKTPPKPHGIPESSSVPSTPAPVVDQSNSVDLTLDTDIPGADPDIIEPTTTNSGVITSTATDPGVVVPATANSGVVDPTATDPSIVIPAATNPGVVIHAAIDPGIGTPAATDPGVVVPATTNPGANNPTIASSGIVDPTTSDPGIVAPASNDPGAATSTDIVGSTTKSLHADGAVTTGPCVDGSTIAGPATTDPNTDPTSVIHSTLGPTWIGSSVIIPTTTVPGPGPPSLTIDPADYPKFLTPEVILHLSSVTNVDGWSDLVQIYLEFESASQSKSVSSFVSCVTLQPLMCILQTTRLPSKGRPPEVGAWLKDPANISMTITDIAVYVKAWTDWWVSCQPPGRAMASWPFACKPFSRDQCSRLLNGGKNGIFLFVMALSWWANRWTRPQAPPISPEQSPTSSGSFVTLRAYSLRRWPLNLPQK